MIDGREAAESLLGWWSDAGVDTAVGEKPRPWLRPMQASADIPLPEELLPPTAPVAPLARPDTLPEFRMWLENAAGLPMEQPGAERVLPRGESGAKIMLLADLPAMEDAAAKSPIGGEAAMLAERMLSAIGFRIEDAYLASLACFHAPGTRVGRDDLEACADLARHHIGLVKPERLVIFGDTPSRALTSEPLARARGRIHHIDGVRAIVTFHPRWLLQRPSDKALAWRDLQLLMSEGE